ncbi:MAG TPA: ABC transporter permease [Chryseolinea sp.]|nr:ABC transporter permease [Chryseolinea sp.]
MLRHNLILIYRSFKRFRSTFLINLIGLSTGLASALLIYLWVNDELHMDKFHEKDRRLYQVMDNHKQNDGWNTMIETAGPLADALVADMPEVEYTAALAPPTWAGFDKFVLTVDERNIRATGQYAGKDYFNIFSYKLIEGDASQVLADKNSIVISEDVAMKLFNRKHNVVGKTIEFQHEREFLISGVFESIPAASSTHFDFVLSFETFREVKPWAGEWSSSGPHVYVVLREGTDVKAFNKNIENFIAKKTNSDVTRRRMFLAPYSDNYLYGNYENGVQSGGRIEYVRLFSVIALFILIIACINFMNLSTAKATGRIKEVGVKKALGAGRKRLAMQYMGESMLMTLLSLITALVLVVLVLPQFNFITGKQIALRWDAGLALSLIGIALFTGIIAGSYPALYLSGFNPVTVLKGKLKSSIGEVWVRKGLVTFQFTLSIILIVSVLVVYKQIDFVQRQNLGYSKDNVIYFDVEGLVKENPETFLAEIKRIPGIQSAASSTHKMTGRGWNRGLSWEGKENDDFIPVTIMAVNHDFIETLDIEMREGRSFSRDIGADTARVIFNEAAIEAMGLKDPIGKKAMGFEIIGVVKNFHFESFHRDVIPQLFILHRNRFASPPSLIMARIEGGKEVETLERINEFYKSYNPGFPLDYRFLDEDYQRQYVSEQRVSTLSRYFAGLAIVISCLGLFGLASFTAQRRLKEIGIRKILGSSDFGIVRLLSGDFTKTVLAAIVIALPLSYFMTRKWLDEFAYRIDLEWWYFAGSGILALLVAWFTVGLQTIRAARVNPTQCIKDE